MIIMSYLYLLINSLISFIKDTLFLLINVSTSHCAPNEEIEVTPAKENNLYAMVRL
jgi:hypothetical protein